MRYMQKFSGRRLEAILFVFITLAYSFLPANGQTTTTSTVANSTGQIQQANVNKLGITLGGQNSWDSGPIMKNLAFINPGFEGTAYRGILNCAAVTEDSCLVADAATAEPAGFWNGAQYQVMSGRSAGATGTVVSDTSGGGGSVLAFDRSLRLSAGDYLSVEVLQSGSGVAGWSSSVSGGGTITAETADLSPETPGKQALLLSALSSGGSVQLSQEIGAQPGQSKLQLNGSYEISFRAKGVGGNNQLNVSVAREASGSAPYLNRPVALTDNWAEYTLSFSASETGTQSSPLQLSFAAAGANIELDDVSLQQGNSSSADGAFRDEVVNGLQDLHPGTIRMVSAGSDVLTQLVSPFARPSQGVNGSVTSAPGTAYGIQEFLQLCAAVGADPWITVPASTTPAEMTDLVQYLTGSGSDTWSALRISRGQGEPWTSVFGKVHIELENGTGISGSSSQPMASSAYAVWSNAVFGAARRSTGYSASKIDLVSSGSGASTSWGTSAQSASKQQDPPFTTTQLSSTQAAVQTPTVAAVTTQADTSASSTPVINFPNGFASAPSTIWLENDATYSGSSIHLVPSTVHNASNAWFKTPENETSFTATFTFHIDCSAQPSDCGGGFGFMMIGPVAGANPVYNPSAGMPGFTYSGFTGAQFSWSQCEQPLAPASQYCYNNGSNGNTGADATQLPDNIILTFNNFNNNYPGAPGASLQAYVTNGTFPAAPVTAENDMAPSGINLNSGDEFSVTLTYNGTTLAETLTDTVTGATYSHNYAANIPAAIGADTAFIGFGGGTGAALDDVYIDSWTYSPGTSTPPATSAAAPTFSPAAGTYTSAQTVSISDSTAGATIYYTTDGTTPTTSSSVYASPIIVSSTETLKAIAVLPTSSSTTANIKTAKVAATTATAATASTTSSPVATVSYTIANSTATPTFSLEAGTYTTTQTVSISDATSGATIYYTINGATPTTSSAKYTGPLTVSSTETIEAMAVATGYNNSSVTNSTYTISASSPNSGTSIFNYESGFAAASGKIKYNGSAKLSGSNVDLTNGGLEQAGSAWYATPVNIQSFTTGFEFQITDPLADGFTFTIQNQGSSALGGLGAGLGYSYIQKSVAVKFDLYNNSGEGPDSTGIYFGGTMPTMPAANLSSTAINLHSGHPMTVLLAYNGTNLTMTITDTVTKGTYTASYPVNIPAIVGANTAYVGFTGGTGGESSTQAINAWAFNN